MPRHVPPPGPAGSHPATVQACTGGRCNFLCSTPSLLFVPALYTAAAVVTGSQLCQPTVARRDAAVRLVGEQHLLPPADHLVRTGRGVAGLRSAQPGAQAQCWQSSWQSSIPTSSRLSAVQAPLHLGTQATVHNLLPSANRLAITPRLQDSGQQLAERQSARLVGRSGRILPARHSDHQQPGLRVLG